MLFQREPLLKASQVHARFHAALPDYTQQPTSKAEEIEAYIYNIYTYTYIFLYICWGWFAFAYNPSPFGLNRLVGALATYQTYYPLVN
jgi:hypothetical protein